MRKLIAVAILLLSLVLAGMFWLRSGGPREVSYVLAKRHRLAAALTTNGKLEPAIRAIVRANTEGWVRQVKLEVGQRIRQGDVLVTVENPMLADGLNSAEAVLTQAQAELGELERGGSEAILAEIDTSMARVRGEADAARKEAASLDRLVARQAATQVEADQAHAKVRVAEQEISSLAKKRSTLVPASSRAILKSRIQQAESAVALARKRIEDAIVRSAVDGVVYDVAIQSGSFVHAGDEIVSVGKMNPLRVVVFVDEPELGRVVKGQKVEISWDAEPGRKWEGTVEGVPTQVVPLNNRQVGEVICQIQNPDGRLPAGANVNVSITTKIEESALTVPKEALRRSGVQDTLLVVAGDHVELRVVKIGITTLTEAQVLSGLEEGDRVVLATEPPLVSGEKVRAKAE